MRARSPQRSAADTAAAHGTAAAARCINPAARHWRCSDGPRGLIVHCHAGCSRDDVLAELRRLGLLDG